MAIDKMNPASAAGAYANIQKAGTAPGLGADKGPSFGDLVRTAASNSIDALHQGEKVSAQAIVGKADLTDVVEAVTAAETTLQTVIALRDRMLGAYQEIMRMPI